VQVTSTGPKDTSLRGQTLTLALTASTAILLDGKPVAASSLRVGQPVSARIVKTPGGYRANQVSATSS
jgi:hypothetical protein